LRVQTGEHRGRRNYGRKHCVALVHPELPLKLMPPTGPVDGGSLAKRPPFGYEPVLPETRGSLQRK
jgi:hypothetical protein